MTNVNNRIVALNGKFANYKTLGRGEFDATARTKDLDVNGATRINFSSGYNGAAKVNRLKANGKA